MKTLKILEPMGPTLQKGDWVGVDFGDGDDKSIYLVRHPHVLIKEPIKVGLDMNKVEVVDVPSTDDMDHTDQDSRNKLVGYCEDDDCYTYYDKRESEEVCEKCGGPFSHWVGFQIESQRTFKQSTAKNKKKPKGK